DLVGVHVPEQQVAVQRAAEPAPDAEDIAGDPERRAEVGLRQDPRKGTVAVGVLRSRERAAGLVRAPRVVPAPLDEVDLVVAFRTVLGLPQTPGPRIEGHPERVAVAVGPDPRPERVVTRTRAVRIQPQDLASKVLFLLAV